MGTHWINTTLGFGELYGGALDQHNTWLGELYGGTLDQHHNRFRRVLLGHTGSTPHWV